MKERLSADTKNNNKKTNQQNLYTFIKEDYSLRLMETKKLHLE